jgi:dinuclear metal center YbgI/SA1388 family protein
MKIDELIKVLELHAPLALQEDYDNAGLIVGDRNSIVKKALICLDITDETLDEAINANCDLIISHHPIIFKGLKKINGKNLVERVVIKAIQNNISIYAIHTNLDNVLEGVNGIIAKKIGLSNTQVLQRKSDLLRKLVTFCPVDKALNVRDALFRAGAGSIGNYDSCSFNVNGYGTFRANEDANPYVGEKKKLHTENEERIEVIYPLYKEANVLNSLLQAHPYEEVAYDIYPLRNELKGIGSGIIGELETEQTEDHFLSELKSIFNVLNIRHTEFLNKKIKKVAICGGSGSFLIQRAKNAGADVFVTGDIKYHDFFEADKKILLVDIGHYESEQFTKELIYSILIKKIPTFALRISERERNPVRYF